MGRDKNNRCPVCLTGIAEATRLMLLLMLVLPTALQAQFNYLSDDSAITITGYTGSNATVIVPAVLDSLPVLSIGTWAFAYTTVPISVTIPNSVTNIGEWAFYDCSAIDVAIGARVTGIGNHAFDSCSSLASVTIPDSVTSIGSYAFSACTNLTSIVIGSGVTSIGNSAFAGCTLLTNVYFLGDAPKIGSSVFDGDNSATVYHVPGTMGWSLTFGGRPTALGNPLAPKARFNYTTNNGAITITRYIGPGGAVVIPANIDNLPVTSVGIGAFAYSAGLTAITIPNGVTNIVDWAFYHCAHLTTATIGNAVTYIGESAFNGCASLKSLYFHGNAPILGPSVFANVSGVTVNYYAATTGWGPTFAGFPTLLWNPQLISRDDGFGVQANQFGFNITGTSNQVVVVEACASLANPVWQTVDTTTLTNTTFHFSDPLWRSYPARIYRLRTP